MWQKIITENRRNKLKRDFKGDAVELSSHESHVVQNWNVRWCLRLERWTPRYVIVGETKWNKIRIKARQSDETLKNNKKSKRCEHFKRMLGDRNKEK